jgi:iron(III) transport system permease protein
VNLRSSIPSILLLVVLLMPFALVWLPGSRPVAGFLPAASPEIRWELLVASIAVGAAAAMGAVIVGSVIAGLLVTTDLPQPSFWGTAALLPFLCPPAVWALAQVHCFGAGGLLEQVFGDGLRPWVAWLNQGHYLSTVLVLATIHAPLAMLIVGRGLGRIHHAGFEAARLFLSPSRLMWWLARGTRQEITAALLLTFALNLGNFAVPHVLQCRLYAIEIYTRMSIYLDQAGALWAATPLLATTLVAVALFAAIDRGTACSAPDQHGADRIRLGVKKWWAMAGLASYLGLTTVLPVAAMIYQCRSPVYFFNAVRDAMPETINTLWLAAAAAAVACGAGLVVGTWDAKRPRVWKDVLALLPLGIPPLIVGLAYARFYNRSWPVDLAVTGNLGLLVILGLAVRAWPFATRIVAMGRRRMAREWYEAAELGGLHGVRRWRWITVRLMADYAVMAAVIGFILATGEVEISQMLCTPGNGTLALRLFTFLHFGPTHVAASLALLQLIIAAVPLLLYFLWSNRHLQVI